MASLQGRGGDPAQRQPDPQVCAAAAAAAADGVPVHVHDGGFPHHALLHHRHPLRQAGEAQGGFRYQFTPILRSLQYACDILDRTGAAAVVVATPDRCWDPSLKWIMDKMPMRLPEEEFAACIMRATCTHIT